MEEIITEWEIAGSPGGLSIMYFETGSSPSGNRAALADFYGMLEGQIHLSTSWNIRQSGRILNPANGELTGFWTDATPFQGTGAGASPVVANSTQVLLQWFTSDIENGRQVRGRTFIPGVSAGQIVGGELSASSHAEWQSDVNALVSDPRFTGVIWHRPKAATEDTPARTGSEHLITIGNVWQELAVQRRRRS